MPRPCQVCAHLSRAEIDARLVQHRCNVAALAREYDVNRKAMVRHRDQHLSTFLKVYGASAIMPTLGELHGEYLRLYSAALDNLARAEAGVLIDIDDKGTEHRRVSPTSIARAISEARKTMDKVVSLAADAAEENERPTGVPDGELSRRITAALDRMQSSTALPEQSDDVSDADLVDLAAEHPALEGAGGLSVGAGAWRPRSNPLDAVTPLSTTPGLTPRVRKVVSDDERSKISIPHEKTPEVVAYVPNPRWISEGHGSAAATSEERSAAGYPDIAITLDDIKSKAHLFGDAAPTP